MLFDIETVKLIKNKINNDGFIDLPANGNSMFPLIQQGELCRFISINPTEIIRGDIILYHSKTGQLIAHRLSHTGKIGETQIYYLKGDSNLSYDSPIMEQQIIGKLISIQKDHRIIGLNRILYSLWGRQILVFPYISGLIRKYLNWKDKW